MFAIGVVSSALNSLQALFSAKAASSQPAGFSQTPPDPSALSDGANGKTFGPIRATGFSQLSPETLGTLIAAQGDASSPASSSPDPTAALQDLFSQIDANGDGQISKSEFENALGAGGTNLAQADDVFSKLDKNGDGNVGFDELSSALKGLGHHHHIELASGGRAGGLGFNGSDPDPLLGALQGASSTSVTNSDGSTTTEITYADGSKVTLTTPSTSSTSSSSNSTSSSNAASSTYNLIEQLIQREAQALASSASPLSLSA
jgi:EF hand domain-containing protein